MREFQKGRDICIPIADSGEALQIAVKRREAKSKGEKESYKHLNAEFQRIALWTWGEGGGAEMYGKSNMEIYITIC